MVSRIVALFHRRAQLVRAFCCTIGAVVCVVSNLPVHVLAQNSTPLFSVPQQSTLSSTLSSAVGIHEAVVARIYFKDQADLHQLAARYDLWHVQHSADARTRHLVALLSTAEVIALRVQGYRIEIDEERTTRLYLQPVFAGAQQAGIPGYPCYRTVAETYTDLETLSANHPTLAQWVDIGDSWNKTAAAEESGFDLQVLVLTNRAIQVEKPVFFLMAAIHAREFTTAELATRFAEYLVNNYGRNADVTWLLDYTEIHIVPQANPDGRIRAEDLILWRKNTNSTECPNENPILSSFGVDLNRNSSFKWNECEGPDCSSSNACFATYRGTAPASEPETQALQNYMSTIFTDQRGKEESAAAPADATGLMISLHSYSRLVLFPWGWRSSPSPNHTQLETLGRKFGYFNGYAVCQAGARGCIYQTDGSTDDWAYGELGVAAYTFELGTEFFQQCTYFEQNIVDQNLAALLYAAKAARRPYQTPAGPEVIQPTAIFTTTATGLGLIIQAQADDSRYASNGWGIEPSQPISAARLTINTPSWITTTQSYAMIADDGSFDTAVENITGMIDISTWEAGKQLIFVEGQDGAGNWGAPTALLVELHRLYLPLMVQE